MRLALVFERETEALVVFSLPTPLPAHVTRDGGLRIRYETTTGALLRGADGRVLGAFDREHEVFAVSLVALGSGATIEVERRAMPSTGLPDGDGPAWRRIVAESEPEPRRTVVVEGATLGDVSAGSALRRASARWRTALRSLPGRAASALPTRSHDDAPLALVGHSHLDVAWLWRYDETRRKAARTFATTVRQLEHDDEFVFAFSQPQEYAWVAEDEPELFGRVRERIAAGSFDASVASMWVESDCNLPSGESLVRQLLVGSRYTRQVLGAEPTVAWLPDSFGFANTLPTIFAHAGIGAFGTTKLGWNDTNAWPYPRFVWEGPDGSRVVAAQIASIEGEFAAPRVAAARERGDPLLVGYGDGGGGVPDRALERASAIGRWTGLGAWFAHLASATDELPVVRDELYLEAHRGVYTTHRDLKARNAALERALAEAELAGAWALALHASRFFLDEFRVQLRAAWEIVLRAQFHDVLPGSVVPGVVDDALADYDRAEALVAQATANARAVLPRAREAARLRTPSDEPELATPRVERGTFVLENASVRAVVGARGEIVDLRVGADGPNLARRLGRLVAYADKPKKYEAWNLDASYADHRRGIAFEAATVVDDGIEVPLRVGDSVGVLRLSLGARARYVRVELGIAWTERRTILRVENETRIRGARVRFGSPHGTIDRRLARRDAHERAKYEVPGQRYARLDDAGGAGIALLSLDGYGWNAHAPSGDARLGHSLLRGTTWPDPDADRGEYVVTFGYAPLASVGTGTLEHLWQEFAGLDAVPMFTCDDDAVLVVATKPAEDGDGVVVRVRECDGEARHFSLRCGGRARAVVAIDAHERELPEAIALVDGALEGELAPFALRAFRVRLA